MPKIVRSSKNKKKVFERLWLTPCAPPPPTILVVQQALRFHHALQYPFLSPCSLALLVTSYFLPYSFHQNTLYASFPFLYHILMSWSSLISPPLSRPLLLLQDCFHLTVAPPPLLRFNFWLPSSCPGSRITNPFFFPFLHMYPMTHMLASKPCLSLSPLPPSIKSLTLRIVTP